MKTLLTALTALAAVAVAQAAELQAAGAIRPDHETKWGALRVSLDQLANAAKEAEEVAADGVPLAPDAEAFLSLGEKVQALADHLDTVAVIVDHAADQVAALIAAKG